MRAAFYTLGCKLNQVETEAIISAFRENGITIVSHEQKADLYLINTCTVTSKSEQKARRMIRKFSRENNSSIIIATGCYVQMEKNDVEELGTNVITVSLDDKDTILDLAAYIGSYDSNLSELKSKTSLWLEEHKIHGIVDDSNRFRYAPVDFSFHSRAFLKIQDGCDNHCAYCRVTIARGLSISLNPHEIIRRLISLSENGYKEVVLTGVNIDSYKFEDVDLAGLLRQILKDTEGFRIRLSSLEPDTLTEDMCKILSDERICPHFHLSIQSGSETILKSMKRNYTRQVVRTAIDQLRVLRRDPFITADIIVGFPGESEKDFRSSMDLFLEMEFSKAHVFPFSPRPGTEAFDMKPQIPERDSRIRAHELRAASQKAYSQFMKDSVGKIVVILLENKDDDNLWYGFSETYIKYKVLKVDPKLKVGDLVQVRIIGVEDSVAKAEFIQSYHYD